MMDSNEGTNRVDILSLNVLNEMQMPLPCQLFLWHILVYFCYKALLMLFTDSFINTPNLTACSCAIVQRGFIHFGLYFENLQPTVLINMYVSFLTKK